MFFVNNLLGVVLVLVWLMFGILILKKSFDQAKSQRWCSGGAFVDLWYETIRNLRHFAVLWTVTLGGRIQMRRPGMLPQPYVKYKGKVVYTNHWFYVLTEVEFTFFFSLSFVFVAFSEAINFLRRKMTESSVCPSQEYIEVDSGLENR